MGDSNEREIDEIGNDANPDPSGGDRDSGGYSGNGGNSGSPDRDDSRTGNGGGSGGGSGDGSVKRGPGRPRKDGTTGPRAGGGNSGRAGDTTGAPADIRPSERAGSRSGGGKRAKAPQASVDNLARVISDFSVQAFGIIRLPELSFSREEATQLVVAWQDFAIEWIPDGDAFAIPPKWLVLIMLIVTVFNLGRPRVNKILQMRNAAKKQPTQVQPEQSGIVPDFPDFPSV